MCHRGGRRYGSYCPQNEGHRVEHSATVLPHQEVHWGIALLAACVRKKPFMRYILSFYSVSGCNTTSRIFMKDSNVPKAVEVASVTLPSTFRAADFNSFRAFLEAQRPGSNRLRFHPTRRMLLPMPMSNIQAGSFPVPYRCYFCKYKGTFDTNT